jgi:hypothetical protein
MLTPEWAERPEHPLVVLDHVLQPGALVRLADQDAVADPAQDFEVALVVTPDLDPKTRSLRP